MTENHAQLMLAMADQLLAFASLATRVGAIPNRSIDLASQAIQAVREEGYAVTCTRNVEVSHDHH